MPDQKYLQNADNIAAEKGQSQDPVFPSSGGFSAPPLSTPSQGIYGNESGLELNEVAKSTMNQFFKMVSPTNSPFPDSISSKTYFDPNTISSRYRFNHPGLNDEEIHGQLQSNWDKIGNDIVKTAGLAIGTFAQSLFSFPDLLSVGKHMDFSKLWDNSYEQDIDNFSKKMEDWLPNYYTQDEIDHPFALRNILSTNFWGDKVIKNLGFTAGAIGGAVAQGVAVGALTDGLGAIPGMAESVGNLSLKLSKIFASSTKTEQLLADAARLGASAERMSQIDRLTKLAAASRLNNKVQYALNLYGAARTEGAIEARDGYNTVREDLISKYKSQYGAEPQGTDLDEIEKYAKASANVRMAGNLVLLSISDAIQFDNILKPFSVAKSGIRNSIRQNIDKEGIQLADKSLDTFEELSGFKNNLWSRVKKTIPDILSEGPFEEGGQFALQSATQKYYEDKYDFYQDPKNKNKDFGSLDKVMSSIAHGLGEEFGTNEGLENVLLGSLTSVITGGFSSTIDKIRGKKNETTLETLSLLNSQSLTGIFSDHYKDAQGSINSVADLKKAVEANDIFEYKNIKAKEFFRFISSAIKAGKFDTRLNQLQLLSELPKEEFEKMFNIEYNSQNQRTVSDYVSSLINAAKGINSRHQAISEVFTNPFNPGKQTDTTEEALDEANKYVAFEDYKTQLAYLASIQEDSNKRISDLSAQINNISPFISTSQAASLMTNKGLKSLRDEYMEKYASTNEAASTFIGNDKRNQQRIAQDYKNKAEEINLLLRTPSDQNLRTKTLEDIANFIINGEKVSTDKSIPKERVEELFIAARDLNRLQQQKQDASKYYDSLTTEAGFNKFFQKRVDSPLDIADEDIPEPFEETEGKFTPGREYSKDKNAFHISKNPDGTYSIKDNKNNIVNTYPSRKEALEASKEMSSLRNTFKVLQTNPDGTVKVQLSNGDIVDLQKYELAGYKSQETPEERQTREAEELAKKNKTLLDSQNNDGINTDISQPFMFEDSKKHSSLLFASTVAFSSKDSGETSKQHHLIANYFASETLPNMKNKEAVRGIVINEQVEERYGLKGLINLSIGNYKPEGGWNNDNKPLLAVVVEQDKSSKYYFLDAYGKRIGELGSNVDINQIVFQTMPTPSLTSFSKSRTRYRNNEGLTQEDLDKLQSSYKEWRAKMLSNSPQGRVYKLASTLGFTNSGISQDIPYAISSIIKDISSRIVKVATTAPEGKHTANISNGIQSVEAPLGYPVLVLSNTIQPLTNRKLTENEQTIIYNSVRVLAKLSQEGKAKDAQAQAIISSLKGMVFWGIPRNATSNSIWYSPDGMLHIGKEGETVPLTEEGITTNKAKILSLLSNMYNNVHATYLNDSQFDNSFNEIIGWNGDIPRIRKWKNYQTYLISDKNPDNSSRKISELPLTTTLPPILPEGVNSLSAQTRNGAYFILNELQTELHQIFPKQEEKIPISSPTSPVNHLAEIIAKQQQNKITEEEKVKSPQSPSISSVISTGKSEDIGGQRKASRIDLSNLKPLERKADLRIASQISTIPENWDRVEKWMGKNLPNVPINRVKNLLHVIGDTYAWGAYSEGAIYVYNNAENGTYFHEAFHAVSRNFINQNELNELRDEFRSRTGSFTNYIDGRTISYSRATDNQIDEQLAEEFRKYIIDKDSLTFGGKIAKFFKELLAWIKQIVTGKQNINNLFKQINSGKYRNYTTGRNIQGINDIDFANGLVGADFKLAPGEHFDLLQHMQGMTLDYFLARDENGNSKGLFEIPKLRKVSFYENMKDLVKRSLIDNYVYNGLEKLNSNEITQTEFDEIVNYRQDLLDKIEENWDNIVKDHQIMMRAYNIEFDENDVLQDKNENKSGRGDWQDATRVDPIKKASLSVKLLFSSIRAVTLDSIDDTYALQNTILSTSSIGGDVLVPMGRSFVTALDNLADKPNFDAQIDALVELAGNDPNFIRLFTALRGSRVSGKIQWDSLSGDDLRLLIAFSKTFSKQKPATLLHYILEDGTAVIRTADIATQTQTLINQWTSNIISNARNGSGYLAYDAPKGDNAGGYYSKGIRIRTQFPSERIKFLNDFGINISLEEYNKLSNSEKKIFNDQVEGIAKSVSTTGKKVVSINRQTLDSSKRIEKLASLIAKIQNPSASSTFFNQNGELQQTYIEKNYVSHFLEVLNNVSSREELNDTQFSYLNTDEFSINSLMMSKMFDEKGNRTSYKPSIGYITGTIDQAKGKSIDVDRLSKGGRLLQEINANLSGYYHLLEPADSGTQWLWNIGQMMSYSDFQYEGLRWNNIYETFSKYLIDEINLVKDERTNVPNSDKLRFFDGILGDTFSKEELLSNISAEELYNSKKQEVNKKVYDFLADKTKNLKEQLFKYNILTNNSKDDGITWNGLNITGTGIPDNVFSNSSLNTLLLYISTNYSLAQMELFKVVFGDPYQSKEWLKRAKSFFSPRETTVHSSPELNNKIDKEYNKGLDIKEVGYMPISDNINTATLEDVSVSTPLYPKAFDEPDAQGIILDTYNRQIRIKASLWNSEDEKQYQYDKAWERLHRNKYINEDLKKKDRELVDRGNPQVATAYYPLKPIGTGNKNNTSYNAVVLDKFSLAPISYRAMYEFAPNSNMLKLLDKMYSQDIGYVVFKSGRKIGSEFSNKLYMEDGSFNPSPLEGIVPMQLQNLGIQVQTQPKEENSQTIGSQLTKLVTIDMMNGGIPIDYIGDNWNSLSENDKIKSSPLYEEIKNNQKILEELQNDGYYSLLKQIGVEDKNTHFEIADGGREKIHVTLEKALLRTDSNDNAKKALEYFKNNLMSLESTNMYQQFKNILYSIVDRNIVSPHVTGGPKVQIASTLWEDERKPLKNGTYASTNLKEYEDEDGKRHIEVYISSKWLRRQLPKSWSDSSKKSYKSDDELFSLVSPEVLKGIGFRIPTQAPNSSDVFVIKKFLPIEMGDSVVVPSSMVAKTGSDFDIDKLNTYLKNVYFDGKTIKSIPYKGIGEAARKELAELKLANEVANEKGYKIDIESESFQFTDEDVPYNADDWYKASLQNAYYDSLSSLLSNPLNFERLTKPNDASLLKGIASEIRKAKGQEDQNTSTPAQLLDRLYVMTNRHNFVTGKNAVGIAAVSQTGHSLRQRINFTIDFSRLKNMDSEMKEWIDEPKLRIGKINYNTYNDQPTLSGINTANGKYIISDIISQFIDGAVDVAKGAWIVDLLGDIRKLPTALFMTELGMDPRTVSFFLNQPIIEDYLQKIDNEGYNWLFIDSFVDDLYKSEKYKTDIVAPIIYTTDLDKTISKTKFTDKEKANQKLILSEFLKLTKMANHLFMATQGTNWDTTDFTDAYIVFKKNEQLKTARKTIFSGVDKMLNNSFIGNTRKLVDSSREAIAQFIPTENPQIRGVIEDVLRKYIGQSNNEFIKTARTVVNSFIDFAIQMKYGWNGDINSLMTDRKNNIPQKLKTFLDNLRETDPNNDILSNPFIKNLNIILGERTNNISLNSRLNDVVNQNIFIHSLQELKNSPIPEIASMYPDIVRLSLLQGIGNSPISFTQLLPVEDVKNILSPIFDNPSAIPEFTKFAELNAFERNNWNNTDIVPTTKIWKKAKNNLYKIFNNVLLSSPTANELFGENLIAIDSMSRVSDGDVISVSYNKDLPRKTIQEMRKNGDYSYIKKTLYQKVYASPGIPLKRSTSFNVPDETDEYGTPISWKKVTRVNIFYKAINAWGDSFRLQEYYSSPQQSQIDNGYTKIKTEYSDDVITGVVRGQITDLSEQNPDEINNNEFPNKDLNIENCS